MRRSRVSVLTYHAVASEIGRRWETYTVLPVQFAAQMALLARLNWRCVPLERVREALTRGDRLPPRTFAITFDDGYDDLVPQVLPVLARHGFTATVFAVTGMLGAPWPEEFAGDPPRRLLTADAVRRLDGDTFRIESHTCTHPTLTEVPSATARRELRESKRWLEDVLGREITTLAYPHGRFDRAVEALVREAGYRAAATTIPGLNGPDTDPFRIRRVTIRARDALSGFLFKVFTGHGFRSAARALVGKETGGPI